VPVVDNESVSKKCSSKSSMLTWPDVKYSLLCQVQDSTIALVSMLANEQETVLQ